MQMVRTADVGSYVVAIYQSSPPQQLLVEEHSRLEWSEEETHASTVDWKRWNCLRCCCWVLRTWYRHSTSGTSTSPS